MKPWRFRFRWPLALLALSLVTAVVHREAPWQPSQIDGDFVLEGDVHVHTSMAGALATPIDIAALARRRQLDFVAVTEHNAWLGGEVARRSGTLLAPEVVILPSEEITNREYHLLAIGLRSRIDPSESLEVMADEVHAQGGVLVAAHPTRPTWPLLLGLASAKKLDGSEIFHPNAMGSSDRALATLADYEAFAREASARKGTPLFAAGSSDFHGGSELGYGRTIVFAKARTATAILEAMRAGRAVAATHDRRFRGDPELVARLEGAHYVLRSGHAAPPRPWATRILRYAAILLLACATSRRLLERIGRRRKVT